MNEEQDIAHQIWLDELDSIAAAATSKQLLEIWLAVPNFNCKEARMLFKFLMEKWDAKSN